MAIRVVEEKYNWNGALTPRTKTNYIVLHHVEAKNCTPQDVHRWHIARGWAGIGYNYLVSKDGTIYRGRPRDVVGAHCQGFNSQSVGISAIGDYENEQMPAAQWNAILALVNELKTVYPGARVVGHKELNATACPGRNYPLEQIKAGVGPNIIQEVLALLFKDVPEGHWAKGSIERLAQLGLLKGDQQGNFNPDAPITRAQLAAVLDRLLQMFGK